MMFTSNYNLKTADAYYAHLNQIDFEHTQAIKMYSPTCDVCEIANVTPDGAWAWCPECEEWVGGCLKCICSDPADAFEPTREWEGYHLW